MGYIEKGRAKTFTKIILWLVVISFVAAIFVTWGAQRSSMVLGTATALRVSGFDITPDSMDFYGNFYRYVRERLYFDFYRNFYTMLSQPVPAVDIDNDTLAWHIASSTVGNSLAGSAFRYGSGQAAQIMLQGVVQLVGDVVLAERAKAAGMRVSDDEMTALLASIYIDRGRG